MQSSRIFRHILTERVCTLSVLYCVLFQGLTRTDSVHAHNTAHVHVPMSFVINNNLTNEHVFLRHRDPEMLIRLFVNEFTHHQAIISEQVWNAYPIMDSERMPKCVRCVWIHWVSQVPMFGFNSRKYNLNLVKECAHWLT